MLKAKAYISHLWEEKGKHFMVFDDWFYLSGDCFSHFKHQNMKIMSSDQ